MNQSQQFSASRHQPTDGTSTGPGSSSSHPPGDELHMSGMSPAIAGSSSQNQQQRHHQQHMSQDYDYSYSSPGPQIKLQQPPSTLGSHAHAHSHPHSHSSSQSQSQSHSHSHSQSQPHHHYQQDSVPNVLQPGGLSGRPSAVSNNTAPALPTLQSSSGSLPPPNQDYHSPSKPSSLSMSHSYSRSSPAANYDASAPGYHPYTPTTPGGPGSSSSQHFMSPPDHLRYGGSSNTRAISNTPLGLADIRPRADSSMSDFAPGTLGYDIANTQPGTSNHMAPWPIYAFDWCKWRPQTNSAGKLAIGSYLEDGHNFIQILDSHLVPTPQDVYAPGSSKYTLEFNKVAEATHSYPVTRLLWEPPSSQKQSTDLLATSGDHLRLWSLPSETPSNPGNNIARKAVDAATKLTPLALLSNSKTPDHTAPLTSLDWNTVSPSLIITSSIDTTCTIWDIPSLTAKTQLIAHDKEVYDVRFCANSVDVFVSCGQDGSVRMFDLRSLEHSTIIYEPTGKDDRDTGSGRASPTAAQQSSSNPPPLLRLATSPHDTHLLATFAQDSSTIRILDVRQPGQALLELRGHSGPINCIEWSPTRRGTLASGGDDCQVLLWDIYNSNASTTAPLNGANQQDGGQSPVASWECDYEVGNLGWVPHLQGDYGEWLGVSAGRGIWGTRVM